jgi:large subunit ribosomal protein L25
VEEGGVLVQILNELEIEALPNALIPSVELDITSLVDIGDSISVGDLEVPDGVTILNSSDETIVQVTWQVAEEEEEEVIGLEEEELLLGEEGEEEAELEEEEEA